MAAYARKLGGDEERWAVTGLVHDLDYERFPDLGDTENGHPRTALRLFAGARLAQDVINGVADMRRSWASRAIARSPRRCSPWTSSGFIAACALVRPTGIVGMAPKSVKKKLKSRRSRPASARRGPQRAGELGVDFNGASAS